MINFDLNSFLYAYRNLTLDQILVQGGDVTDDDMQEILKHVRFARDLFRQYGLLQGYSRLRDCFERIENGTYTVGTLAHDLNEILKIVDDEARHHSFYQYQQYAASFVYRLHDDWHPAWHKFPSTYVEIEQGVASFAQRHFAGSIFYFMRAAELGLRALARERSVKLRNDRDIEYAQWQEILSAVGDRVKEIARTAKAGPAKDQALAFYNGAIAHCTALKDKYRNNCMHVRHQFQENDAENAMFHTREFLNGLASKLSERQKTPINWKF